jgi:hypothetical protein
MELLSLDNVKIDPALIRNYHFVRTKEGEIKVQFVGIGDKHRMMKQDDGSVIVVKQSEQGKPYRYGPPQTIEDALSYLSKGAYNTHQDIADHIRENAPT